VDDQHQYEPKPPLLVDAVAPRSLPRLTAAFAGIGGVREAAAVNQADCCTFMDASARIGVGDVAGLDEQRQLAARVQDYSFDHGAAISPVVATLLLQA
jgi:hypothetical protein